MSDILYNSSIRRASIQPGAARIGKPAVSRAREAHAVRDGLRSPARALETSTRALLERRFGQDFSHVRVHTGLEAAASARAVNAVAYTVGRDVVFGQGRYDPQTSAGQRLLVHELTHVVQQSGGHGSYDGLRFGSAGDHIEREARAASQRISEKGRLGEVTHCSPAVQCQSPGEETQKPPEKKDAGDVVVEGLKTVAGEAKDDNPKVKQVLIDPLKDRLKLGFNRLSTGEKVGVIGFGAGTVGMAGGAMLSNPGGRKTLEGLNLAAPLTLIPYMPLSSFKYTLPTGATGDQRLFKFETSFNADDLINLRTESRGLPKMSLGVHLQWGYDPATERLTLTGGDASLGIVPGLTLSAGAYKDVLRPTPTFLGPEGQTTQLKQSVPEFGKPQPIPDVRIMVNVDLMKFKPGDLARQLKGVFSGGK